MRLVNCIGVIMAELVDNFGDAVMVAFGKSRSDGGLESGDVVSQWTQILCASSCAIILNLAMVRTAQRVAQYGGQQQNRCRCGTYSRAPPFLLSYSLSCNARDVAVSISSAPALPTLHEWHSLEFV